MTCSLPRGDTPRRPNVVKANSRSQAGYGARGTKERPATSTGECRSDILPTPWSWTPGPNTGERFPTRGVRAFAPDAITIPLEPHHGFHTDALPVPWDGLSAIAE